MSDEEIEEQLRKNLKYKWECAQEGGLVNMVQAINPVYVPYFDSCILRKYRADHFACLTATRFLILIAQFFSINSR